MSTKDKTREKLLNSMRKTKAVISEQPDSKQAHAETYAPAPAKPARADRPAVSARVAGAREKFPASPLEAGNDPYQSHDRVWPD